MSDLCNQCREELGFEPTNPYEVLLYVFDAMMIYCEGCGTTTIDRAGNCLGNHSFTKIVHKEKD